MSARLPGGTGALILDLCRRMGLLEGRPAAIAEIEAAIAHEAARVVLLSGMLVIPAKLAIGVGKTPCTVPVSGLCKGDRVFVTPIDPLPAGLALVEPQAAKDGELTQHLMTTTLLAAASTARSFLLAVTVLR